MCIRVVLLKVGACWRQTYVSSQKQSRSGEDVNYCFDFHRTIHTYHHPYFCPHSMSLLCTSFGSHPVIIREIASTRWRKSGSSLIRRSIELQA